MPDFIEAEFQKLSPGHRVELFDFDATSIDGSTFYRFCSSFDQAGDVVWQGNTYSAIQVEGSGWERSTQGPFPTPRLKISNIALLPSAIINTLGEPYGAIITRWVTFSDFLDGGSRENPDIYQPPEIFVVERLVTLTKFFVEFELSAKIDAEGEMLPRRLVLNNSCTHVYRIWREEDSLPGGGYFDYADPVTCPYAGSDDVPGGTETPYFKRNGDGTTLGEEDICGKKLSDCRARFGQNAELPYRGFPGVERISQ
jgi:lambda family phage minor tail protein L